MIQLEQLNKGTAMSQEKTPQKENSRNDKSNDVLDKIQNVVNKLKNEFENNKKRKIIIGVVVVIVLVIGFGAIGNRQESGVQQKTEEAKDEMQQKAEAFYSWFSKDWKKQEEKTLQILIDEKSESKAISDQEKRISQIDAITGFYTDNGKNLKIKVDYNKAKEIGVSGDDIATQVNVAIYQYPELETLDFTNFNYAQKNYGWRIKEDDVDWGEYQEIIDKEKEERDQKESELETAAWANCESYGKSHYYGFKWHTITGLQASEAYNGGWLMKVSVDVSNKYGAKTSGTMECITDGKGEVTSFVIY